MSPRPDASERIDRRRFLRTTAAVGVTAATPATVGRFAGGRSSSTVLRPPGGDVEHAHPMELPTLRRQVSRYRADEDPTALYNPSLLDHLRRRPDRGTVDLAVRTAGEPSVHEMRGPMDRTVHGWRPSDEEVAALLRYGEVGFVGDLSTTVTLRGVARSDVESVASVPGVVEVTHDPPLRLDRPRVEAKGGIPVSALRGSDYFRFSELPDDASVPSWLRIGIVDRGYGGAGDFEAAHAEAMGIDEDLARDFTVEDRWRDEDSHGSNVANTCATLLPDGHDDLFVPLKVLPTGRTPSRSDARDNVRAAIEYAEKHGIGVLNLSLGTDRSTAVCPSVYCPELFSYADAGFLAFAAIGNREVEGVEFPGGERCSIGVGGIGGACGGGRFERYVGPNGYYGSSYGTVRYHDPFASKTYCHYCRYLAEHSGGFSPSVYGCYLQETDAGVTLAGTSFASPQAAAAGALALGNARQSYEEVAATFRGMDRHGICPDEAAGAGQLLDAEHAYQAAVESAERNDGGSDGNDRRSPGRRTPMART